MKQSILFQKLLSFLFPEKCLSCNKTGKPICSHCVSQLTKSGKTELPYAHALFSYKNKTTEKIVKNLKNHQRPELAEIMARLMYPNFLPEISDLALFEGEKIIIVPIPASNSHMKKRFKNHSLLLAEKFVENNHKNFELCDCLTRTRSSSPQSETRTREARIKNAENLYKVREKLIPQISGKAILIIDDITTTGATIENSKIALKKVGAGEIMAIAFAH